MFSRVDPKSQADLVDAFFNGLGLRVMSVFPDMAAGISHGRQAGVSERFLADLYAVDAGRVLEHLAGRMSGWRPYRRLMLRRCLQRIGRSNFLPLVESLLDPGVYTDAYRLAWCYRGGDGSSAGRHRFGLLVGLDARLGRRQEIVPVGVLLYILEHHRVLGVSQTAGERLTPEVLRAGDLFVAQVRELMSV